MIPTFDHPEDDHQTGHILHIAKLLAKQRVGNISDAEKAELDRWAQDRSTHDAWRAGLLDDKYVSALLETYRKGQSEVESSLEVFHRKHLDKAPVAPSIRGEGMVVQIPARSRMRKWWIAAAVSLPLIVAGVWISGRKEGAPVVAKSPRSEIRPGHNVATLTLGNGTRVVLDTGASTLGNLNNNVRIDYKAGKVAYPDRASGIEDVVFNTLTTPKGGQYQLLLSDGTKVWLNAMSSLRYPTSFMGKERRVILTGEAYFEVAGKKDQPFMVDAAGMNVRVLGTEFDIMAYPEEGLKKATLVKGAVKVNNGKDEAQLRVGEQAVVAENGALSMNPQVDVESVIAWRSGFFTFAQMDIKSLMREMARWYDIDVVYERGDLSGKFGGRISRNLNLSELISLLEGNGIAHFRIEGRRLIVLP